MSNFYESWFVRILISGFIKDGNNLCVDVFVVDWLEVMEVEDFFVISCVVSSSLFMVLFFR